jgi:uncharacterized protein YpmS
MASIVINNGAAKMMTFEFPSWLQVFCRQMSAYVNITKLGLNQVRLGI